MGRTERATPAELTPGWPHEASTDPIAEVARRFALNLAATLGDRSKRSVADAAGINHATLLGILAGRAWPDLSTIARLERTLGPLWPGEADLPHN